MKKNLLFLIIIISIGLIAEEPHFMSDPAISADGESVCFMYMNDLWVVSFEGGDARRITVSEGKNWGPAYSPDGKTIAFNTNRDGWTHIYNIASEGGIATSVCAEGFTVVDWIDSKTMLATGSEPGFGSKFFEVKTNGEFKEITKFGGFYCNVSPDAEKIIYARRGMPFREKYRGSTNGELWEYNIPKEKYTKLTDTDFTERYPVYSKTEDAVYYAAPAGEVFQIYKVTNNDYTNPIALTNFKTWSVRDLSIAQENDRMVFEHFHELWKYDPAKKKASKLNVDIKQDFLSSFLTKQDVRNKADKFAISNDGKLIVFSYKFDLFAVPEKGGDVIQITSSQSVINDIVIMDDNQTIYFTSIIKGQPNIFKTNIKNTDDITLLSWSKDKYVEWIANEKNRLVINWSENIERNKIAMAKGNGDDIETIIPDKTVHSSFSVSPDDKYAFYSTSRPEVWTRHMYLYDMETKKSSVVKSSYGWFTDVTWGKDGKSAFVTIGGNINRIDLTAADDFYKEKDHWESILDPDKKKNNDDEDEDEEDDEKDKDKDPEQIKKEKEKKEKKRWDKLKKEKAKPTKIDTEDIDNRFSKVISKPGWNYVVHVIDDSTLYYVNQNEKKYTLRKTDYSGENDKRIYSFGSEPDNITYNARNRSFYYTEKNSIKKLKNKKASVVKYKFKYNYDRLKLNKDVFDQVWTEFGRGFYDPKMHGVDWDKMYKKYLPYMEYAYDAEAMSYIVDEMIGEVNASHTGFYPRGDSHNHSYGLANAGFTVDLQNFPKKGLYINKIYRKSKLNKPFGITKGDILMKVDGEEVGEGTSLNALFADKTGQKMKLDIETANGNKTITIKGLSGGANYNLYYDNWVNERAEKTDKLSEGRIGYLHIRSMDGRSYDQFIQDIFAENYDKEALVIDVRNNGGGNIHDRLIEVLTKKQYAYNSSRYHGAQIGKNPGNIWDKPVVVLINEDSFSDAEIFPTLFKTMKLGKVIGMPTSGSVIGTGHVNFADGSSMRMPGHGWYTKEMVNMEGNGAQPDIYVDITPEEMIADDDVQLQRAVIELFKQMRVYK